MKTIKTKTFADLISVEDSKKYHGFVYRIDIAGFYYIGKKMFAAKDKWEFYKSSSKKVKELLKTNTATYTVLKFAKTKRELSYFEAEIQFKMNVLEDPLSLNDNILRVFQRNVHDELKRKK